MHYIPSYPGTPAERDRFVIDLIKDARRLYKEAADSISFSIFD